MNRRMQTGKLFLLSGLALALGLANTGAAPGQSYYPPRAQPPQKPKIRIHWGDMGEYLRISNLRVAEHKFTDPLGQVHKVHGVAFDVECTRNVLLLPFFEARYYDAQGVELPGSGPLMAPVTFEPNPQGPGGWRPGVRSRAFFMLPADRAEWARIAEIRISGI
jgi:hypothetical protein